MSRTRSKLASVVVASVAWLAAGEEARAETAPQCIAAFDRGQDLRAQSKLIAAKKEFLSCASSSCPPAVRKDCAEHAEVATRETPTVTFGGRTASGDVEDLLVILDGGERVHALPGQAFALDPGSHHARLEAPATSSSRPQVVEQRFVVRLGEQHRAIIVTFDEPSRPPSRAAQEKPDQAKPSSDRTLGWVFGGAGVATFGAFVVLGLLGNAERDAVSRRCAPHCSTDDTSTLRAFYITADVSLVVSALAFGAATYFFLRDPIGASPSNRDPKRE